MNMNSDIHRRDKSKRGPYEGIMITYRDIELLKALRYGRLNIEQLYRDAWFKRPEYQKGGELVKPQENDKGSIKNFRLRINKLIRYGYINREIIPTCGFNEVRTILSVGDNGAKILYESGELIVRNHPVKLTEIQHDLMATYSLKKLSEGINYLEKQIDISHYEIDYEYNMRREKENKKGAVYPDSYGFFNLRGQETDTQNEVEIIRIVYVEIDNSSFSVNDFVDRKICTLAEPPHEKFGGAIDKHVVFVVVNNTQRLRKLLNRIKHRKNEITNWKNIGIGLFSDVLKYGFFSNTFRNCDGNAVTIISKKELGEE
jgi:hypothetical protein